MPIQYKQAIHEFYNKFMPIQYKHAIHEFYNKFMPIQYKLAIHEFYNKFMPIQYKLAILGLDISSSILISSFNLAILSPPTAPVLINGAPNAIAK